MTDRKWKVRDDTDTDIDIMLRRFYTWKDFAVQQEGYSGHWVAYHDSARISEGSNPLDLMEFCEKLDAKLGEST